MLIVFTSLTYYEITLVSLGYFKVSVLKSCIVSKVKILIFKGTKMGSFYLFVMDCKNFERGVFFQKRKRISGKGCLQ